MRTGPFPLDPFPASLCWRQCRVSQASSVSRAAAVLTPGPTVVPVLGIPTVAGPEPAPVSAAWHAPHAPNVFAVRSARSRGTAAATSCICETFSSRVMRETRSFTRCSNGRLGSRYAERAGSFAAEVFGAVCAVMFEVKKNTNRNAASGRKRRLDTAKILSHSMPRVHPWFER